MAAIAMGVSWAVVQNPVFRWVFFCVGLWILGVFCDPVVWIFGNWIFYSPCLFFSATCISAFGYFVIFSYARKRRFTVWDQSDSSGRVYNFSVRKHGKLILFLVSNATCKMSLPLRWHRRKIYITRWMRFLPIFFVVQGAVHEFNLRHSRAQNPFSLLRFVGWRN